MEKKCFVLLQGVSARPLMKDCLWLHAQPLRRNQFFERVFIEEILKRAALQIGAADQSIDQQEIATAAVVQRATGCCR